MTGFFFRPWAAWLLALPAGVALLAAAHFRWKIRSASRLGDPALIASLAGAEAPRRQRLKAVMTVAALALLVLSLAGPRWGRSYETARRKGVDIVVAVDVSASMLAEDLQPNRLTQAKRALGLLIDGLEGDRVGVVAFAGTAFLQCPLTLDRAAARSLLEVVEPDLIPVPGTDLAAALETSLNAFPAGSRTHKAVVLLTDGEDHSRRLEAAVKRAADGGARIYAVGLGSPSGEVIPIRDEQGNVTDYKKDKNGKTVVSKLGEDALKGMAARTGGAYYRATPGEGEMDRLLSDLKGLDRKVLEDRTIDRRRDRYQGPLALAVLLMLLELLWPERAGHFRRMREGRASRRAAAALLLLALIPAPSRAAEDRAVRFWRERVARDPADAEAQTQLGQSLYRAGDAAGAAEAFDRAKDLAKDPARRAEASYNAGDALVRSQKPQDALDRYKAALLLNPDDADAKHNYELVRRQMKKGGGGGKMDRKDDKGDKKPVPASGQQPSPAPQKPGDLSREDAERILQDVERQEKEARRNAKKPPSRSTADEDW